MTSNSGYNRKRGILISASGASTESVLLLQSGFIPTKARSCSNTRSDTIECGHNRQKHMLKPL
jgi:hypothetical protein